MAKIQDDVSMKNILAMQDSTSPETIVSQN
jgi:hypothetical protein